MDLINVMFFCNDFVIEGLPCEGCHTKIPLLPSEGDPLSYYDTPCIVDAVTLAIDLSIDGGYYYLIALVPESVEEPKAKTEKVIQFPGGKEK